MGSNPTLSATSGLMDGRSRRWRLRSVAHGRLSPLAPGRARRLALATSLKPSTRGDADYPPAPAPAAAPTIRSPERSPSGLWRRTGNAVRGNASRVRIPPSPPPTARAPTLGRPAERSESLTRARPTITRLDVGEFTFPPDEPWPGETGVVVAYLIRHPDGIVLLDTGLGLGESELDERYHPRPRPIAEVLATERLGIGDIDIVVNCHLHADHAGQNVAFPRRPIYVQPAERAMARTAEYTIARWIDGPGIEYREIEGDHELLPGVRVLATPGHSPGHQSMLVETDEGPTILAGQALYSVEEWTGRAGAREGRTSARDQPAYDRSVERLKSIDPVRVWFGHDRETWVRSTGR